MKNVFYHKKCSSVILPLQTFLALLICSSVCFGSEEPSDDNNKSYIDSEDIFEPTSLEVVYSGSKEDIPVNIVKERQIEGEGKEAKYVLDQPKKVAQIREKARQVLQKVAKLIEGNRHFFMPSNEILPGKLFDQFTLNSTLPIYVISSMNDSSGPEERTSFQLEPKNLKLVIQLAFEWKKKMGADPLKEMAEFSNQMLTQLSKVSDVSFLTPNKKAELSNVNRINLLQKANGKCQDPISKNNSANSLNNNINSIGCNWMSQRFSGSGVLLSLELPLEGNEILEQKALVYHSKDPRIDISGIPARYASALRAYLNHYIAANLMKSIFEKGLLIHLDFDLLEIKDKPFNGKKNLGVGDIEVKPQELHARLRLLPINKVNLIPLLIPEQTIEFQKNTVKSEADIRVDDNKETNQDQFSKKNLMAVFKGTSQDGSFAVFLNQKIETILNSSGLAQIVLRLKEAKH